VLSKAPIISMAMPLATPIGVRPHSTTGRPGGAVDAHPTGVFGGMARRDATDHLPTIDQTPAGESGPGDHVRFGRVGLGAMPLSERGRPDRWQAKETIHAALDAGVRLIDTADAYCLDRTDVGHNEILVAEALASWDGPRADVVVASKGGHIRDDEGNWDVDGRPSHLRSAALASRDRLGVDRIRLYQFHRPDPSVPFEQSVEAVAELQRDGIIEHVGLSNVSVEQLESACAIVRVASVQNELSPYVCGSMDVVAWCHRNDVPFLAWAPLGGAARAGGMENDPAVVAFAEVAVELGVSTQRVVLAWLLSLSPAVTVIPGARRVASIVDSVAAADLQLDGETSARLDLAVQQRNSRQAPPRS
jgi:aryl-alcohol dehydrogenase-like predicted oxidoreductase